MKQKWFQIKGGNKIRERGWNSKIWRSSCIILYVTFINPMAEKFPEARQTFVSLRLRFPSLKIEYQWTLEKI